MNKVFLLVVFLVCVGLTGCGSGHKSGSNYIVWNSPDKVVTVKNNTTYTIKNVRAGGTLVFTGSIQSGGEIQVGLNSSSRYGDWVEVGADIYAEDDYVGVAVRRFSVRNRFSSYGGDYSETWVIDMRSVQPLDRRLAR